MKTFIPNPTLAAKPKTHGLTLGKFAPLHKGHQFLIETALSETDAVAVIIYDCPETFHVPLNVRARWIRDLYPEVHVIEAWDGPAEVGDTPEIRKRHEDYIRRDLKVCGITHFFSSEFYGDHMSRALNAVNRLVDPPRNAVPISGTRIRNHPFAFRNYLHPRVYRDMIGNVVFLGAPSTGKTTLAQALAREYKTVWMPEYGREYWEQNQKDRRLSPEQLVAVAEGHLEREEQLLYAADRFLFTDTNALTTRIFAQYYHGYAEPKLEALADKASFRYDLVFVCDTDIPCEDSWDRSGDGVREVFQKLILADLRTRKIPYITLQGSVEARISRVKGLLKGFQKYMNTADLYREGPRFP